jgi:poly(beta-D-mannuronate) lyase
MDRTTRFLLAFLFALAAAGSARGARADCPSEPAPPVAEAQAFYADAKGSVVDSRRLRQQLASIAPIRRFVTEASARADSADRSDRACALGMLESWARGRALLEEPGEFAGMRERQRWAIALNVVALKLRAGGADISPLLGWLGELNRAVMRDFGRRNRADNLNAWSGVTAASFAVLQGDREARSYADLAWRQGIGAIRPDGYIDTELARGGRALLYHAYYLSALMTLQGFRHALGDETNARDRAALERLASRVGDGLCDSSVMAAASRGGPQEKVAILELGPIAAFAGGLGGPDLLKCAPPEIPRTDPVMGGDLPRTARILASGRR